MKLIIDIPKTDFAFITQFTIMGLGMLKYRDIQVNTLNAIKQCEIVKQGEWQITKAGYAKCPFCRCEREILENYCGYCGADMRGEKK